MIATELSPRGMIGVLPRPSKLADESYTDFVEAFRDMALVKMFPIMCGAGHSAMAAAGVEIASLMTYFFRPKADNICSDCFCICSCIWVKTSLDCST